MELICPACRARFRVDGSRIGPNGQKVRCGRCRHEWVQHRHEPETEAAANVVTMTASLAGMAGGHGAASQVIDSPMSMKAFAPGSGSLRLGDDGSGSGALLAGWLVFFLIVAGIVLGAWYKREWIVEQAPAAARIYALVGIDVASPADALQLYDVTSVRRTVDGQRLLVVEGKIRNTSDAVQIIPELQAEITTPEGDLLATWRFPPGETELAPGESTVFQTSTENPPRDGNLAIVFAGAPS